MIRAGHIVLKLKDGVETRAPAHLDVLDGAQRAGSTVDGHGAVDHAILSRTTGLRAKRCFHAAASLGAIGTRHTAYDPLECRLGLHRVVMLRIAEPDRTHDIVEELRALDEVEWAMAEILASVPFQAARSHSTPTRLCEAREHVGADRGLEMEPGSRAIAVAVIDTGVALDHSEFAGRLRSGYDTVDLGMGRVADGVSLVGDSLGRDFCARDETGHGSHVAGVIGARGLSIPPGIAGRAALIPIRALAAAQAGGGPVFGVGGLSDINAAIKVSVDMRAKVLNMSFGTARAELDPDAPPPHADALAYAEARNCIPVAAMGNSGSEEEFFPAALPGCIAVGSMSLDGERSEFSTMGHHIALCAPGEHVMSAGLEGYRESSGTSHAAPFVSGAVALLAARAMARDHDLTVTEARQALCHSARGGDPNPQTGWGMLNVPAALARLDQMLTARQEDQR